MADSAEKRKIGNCTEHDTAHNVKPAIMAVRKANNLVNNARPIHLTSRSDSSALKQPKFN